MKDTTAMVSYLLIGERCLIATVFAFAFFGKARDASRWQLFVTAIQKLTMLPARTAMCVALAVVISEGTIVALLVFPPVPRAGFVLATALLTMFIVMVARGVRGGVLAECRCFGRSGPLTSSAMIVRNLLLIACALPGIIMSPTTPAADPVRFAFALIIGFTIAVCFVRFYDELARGVITRLSVNSHERRGVRREGA